MQYLQPLDVFEKSIANSNNFFQFGAIWLIYNHFKGNRALHLLSIKPHLLLNCRKTIPAVGLLLTSHHVPAERLEVLKFTESTLIALTELGSFATNSPCIMMRLCYTNVGKVLFSTKVLVGRGMIISLLLATPSWKLEEASEMQDSQNSCFLKCLRVEFILLDFNLKTRHLTQSTLGYFLWQMGWTFLWRCLLLSCDYRRDLDNHLDSFLIFGWLKSSEMNPILILCWDS